MKKENLVVEIEYEVKGKDGKVIRKGIIKPTEKPKGRT